MAIEARRSCRFGIVAMPHRNVLQTDGVVQILHRVLISLRRDDVIACGVHVTGIHAPCHGNNRTETLYQFRDLLEGTAQRVFGPGGILNYTLKPQPARSRPSVAFWMESAARRSPSSLRRPR